MSHKISNVDWRCTNLFLGNDVQLVTADDFLDVVNSEVDEFFRRRHFDEMLLYELVGGINQRSTAKRISKLPDSENIVWMQPKQEIGYILPTNEHFHQFLGILGYEMERNHFVIG